MEFLSKMLEQPGATNHKIKPHYCQMITALWIIHPVGLHSADESIMGGAEWRHVKFKQNECNEYS